MATTDFVVPDLPDELGKLLQQVPAGSVTTYGDLADALGSKSAARWVGEFMMRHDHTASRCCHRVVCHSGDVGLYRSGDLAEKVRLLVREGVPVENGRVNLNESRVVEFETRRPLRELSQIQTAIARNVVLRPLESVPNFVGGIDVSYLTSNEGVAAYAKVEVATGRLVWSTTIRRTVRFQYIPGFLAYREIALLAALLETVELDEQLDDVVLVDGSGILHHRGAGIATHLGVVADITTIGITKSLLCGRVDLKEMKSGSHRPIEHQDQIVGRALLPSNRRKPIFVSPGHQIDVDGAVRVAESSLRGHKLPEPIHHADAISCTVAKEIKAMEADAFVSDR